MAYRRSIALGSWTLDRRDALRVVEEAHRAVTRDTPGAGRPIQRGGDHLAQAFIVRLYAEFQGFVRDLHDVTAEALMRGLEVQPENRPPLIAAATVGRGIDQGNVGLRTIGNDFKRLGIGNLIRDVSRLNPQHGVDQQQFDDLTRLRNAIAHGNAEQLGALRNEGIKATLTYGRSVLPALNRMARAFDRAVWNHLEEQFPAIDPW